MITLGLPFFGWYGFTPIEMKMLTLDADKGVKNQVKQNTILQYPKYSTRLTNDFVYNSFIIISSSYLKFTWINKFDELLENCLLDHSSLVQALCHLIKINDGTNILTKFLDLEF